MPRRSKKIHDELAALDEEVNRSDGNARRIHKAIPITIVMLVLIGFSTLTWHAYNQGILEGSEEAAPYLRPSSALKSPPENPGGLEVPYRKVHVLHQGDQEKIRRFSPPPEEPKEFINGKKLKGSIPTRPAIINQGNGQKKRSVNVKPNQHRTATEAFKQSLDLVKKGAPPAIVPPNKISDKAGTSAKSIKVSDASLIQNQKSPKAISKKSKNEGKKLSDQSSPQLGPIRLTPKKRGIKALTKKDMRLQKNIRPEKKKIHSGTEKFFVQLGAHRSKLLADRAWKVAKDKYPVLLGAKKLVVQRVKVPKKGLFFRVQSGPFNNSTAAKKLCSSLKSRKQGCFIVKRK